MASTGHRHVYHLSGPVIALRLYQPTHTAFLRKKHMRATCDSKVGVAVPIGLFNP